MQLHVLFHNALPFSNVSLVPFVGLLVGYINMWKSMIYIGHCLISRWSSPITRRNISCCHMLHLKVGGLCKAMVGLRHWVPVEKLILSGFQLFFFFFSIFVLGRRLSASLYRAWSGRSLSAEPIILLVWLSMASMFTGLTGSIKKFTEQTNMMGQVRLQWPRLFPSCLRVFVLSWRTNSSVTILAISLMGAAAIFVHQVRHWPWR